MLQVTFKPLTVWPKKPTEKRRTDPFRAPYAKTLAQLEAELRHLGGTRVVIQVALDARDIRQDGLPRADAKAPRHPGVVLAFDSRHGPLSYPCDTYKTWEGNLRAIVLALEALRAVNRYGVSASGEQYRGWTALPPPRQKTVYFSSAADAAGWMARRFAERGGDPGAVVTTQEVLGRGPAFQALYRALAAVLHPDRGGDEEEFKKLQEARALVEGGG